MDEFEEGKTKERTNLKIEKNWSFTIQQCFNIKSTFYLSISDEPYLH